MQHRKLERSHWLWLHATKKLEWSHWLHATKKLEWSHWLWLHATKKLEWSHWLAACNKKTRMVTLAVISCNKKTRMVTLAGFHETKWPEGVTSEMREVYLGLARTMHIQCTYSNFGRKITKYTVIYGAYIQLWPTLCILYAAFCTQVGSGPLQKGVLIRRPHTQQALAIKTKESFALLCARIPAPPSLYSLTHEHHFKPSGHRRLDPSARFCRARRAHPRPAWSRMVYKWQGVNHVWAGTLIRRAGHNHIYSLYMFIYGVYIYGVHTCTYLAGKPPNIPSYTVLIYKFMANAIWHIKHIPNPSRLGWSSAIV